MNDHEKEQYQAAFSHVVPRTEIRYEDMERRARATRFRRIKPAIWAAVVALMVLMSVAVVAVGLLSLRELQLTHNAYPDIPGDTMSLAGVVDSKEYQAANEWESYLETLDLNVISAEAEKQPPLPEQYTNYTCYNEEMREKLDSIAEKYGLQLHQRIHAFYRQPIADRQGVSLVAATHTAETGYFYDDGTFSVSGHLILQGRGEVSYNIYNHQKGMMSDVNFNAGDMNSYEQWNYSANGADLLLALGPDRSIIIWNNLESLVTVVILGGTGQGDYITMGHLEKKHVEIIADAIYFSRLHDIALEESPEQRQDSESAVRSEDELTLIAGSGITFAQADALLENLEKSVNEDNLAAFASYLSYPCLVTTPEGSYTATDPDSFIARCPCRVSDFFPQSPTHYGESGYFPKDGLAGTVTGEIWMAPGIESEEILVVSALQCAQNYRINPTITEITHS